MPPYLLFHNPQITLEHPICLEKHCERKREGERACVCVSERGRHRERERERTRERERESAHFFDRAKQFILISQTDLFIFLCTNFQYSIAYSEFIAKSVYMCTCVYTYVPRRGQPHTREVLEYTPNIPACYVIL